MKFTGASKQGQQNSPTLAATYSADHRDSAEAPEQSFFDSSKNVHFGVGARGRSRRRRSHRRLANLRQGAIERFQTALRVVTIRFACRFENPDDVSSPIGPELSRLFEANRLDPAANASRTFLPRNIRNLKHRSTHLTAVLLPGRLPPVLSSSQPQMTQQTSASRSNSCR